MSRVIKLPVKYKHRAYACPALDAIKELDIQYAVSNSTENKEFVESEEWVKINSGSITPSLSSEYVFDSNIPKNIEIFICANGKQDTGDIPLIPKEYLTNTKILHFQNLYQNEKLIGNSISLILPIRISDSSIDAEIKVSNSEYQEFLSPDTVLFGQTHYLTIDRNLRKQSLGINLIRSIIDYGHSKNIKSGYFVNSYRKTGTAYSVNVWYRVINPDNAAKAGYGLHLSDSRVSSTKFGTDRTGLRTKLFYKNIIPKNYEYELAKAEDLDQYISMAIEKKLAYIPTLEHWNCFIKLYPTYKLTKDFKIVGFFSLFIIENFAVKHKTKTKICNLLFTLGPEQKAIVKTAAYIAETLEADILRGYLIGDLTKDDLEKTMNLGEFYLEFYNHNNKYKLEDICIPII